MSNTNSRKGKGIGELPFGFIQIFSKLLFLPKQIPRQQSGKGNIKVTFYTLIKRQRIDVAYQPGQQVIAAGDPEHTKQKIQYSTTPGRLYRVAPTGFPLRFHQFTSTFSLFEHTNSIAQINSRPT